MDTGFGIDRDTGFGIDRDTGFGIDRDTCFADSVDSVDSGDLWSPVLFSCSYQFALFFSQEEKAMVVDFDTFDSHPPFLLNGDVGTGCLRVCFSAGFSLYIPAFPSCTRSLQPKRQRDFLYLSMIRESALLLASFWR